MLITGCASQPANQGAAPAQGAAQPNWPTTVADIALYQGADRQQMLEAGARKEGKVAFYGSSNIEEMRAFADNFMQKYPWIKVEFTRVDSSDMVPRVLQEHQAGQLKVDLVMTSLVEPLVVGGAMSRWHSPELAALPKGSVDDKGFKAVRVRYNYGLAYNTNLVPADRAPKNWDDLLDPWWQGKILAEGPYDTKFSLGILKAMGPEKGMAYLEKLAKNAVLQKGSTARVNSVLAGEKAAAIGVYLYYPEQMIAEKKAPLQTTVFNPTVVNPQWVGLTKNAPNPHAAMLLLDWKFSREGMQAQASTNIVGRLDVQYSAPYLQTLQNKLKAVDALVLNDAWYPEELPPLEKTLRKLYGIE